MVRNYIDIGSDRILFESSLRGLGVLLDSKLPWKDQVAQTSRRVRSLMYRLYHFRKNTNLRLRKHLISMLLFPIIDYCCLAFCDLTLELDDKLQKLVNTGIRYIYGVRRKLHITPYRLKLGWLTTSARRDYFVANLLRRLFNTATPSYLLEFFNFRFTTRPVWGNVAVLDISSCVTETLKRSFHISSAYLWNSLPSYLRDVISIPHFKSRLHQHLLHSV